MWEICSSLTLSLSFLFASSDGGSGSFRQCQQGTTAGRVAGPGTALITATARCNSHVNHSSARCRADKRGAADEGGVHAEYSQEALIGPFISLNWSWGRLGLVVLETTNWTGCCQSRTDLWGKVELSVFSPSVLHRRRQQLGRLELWEESKETVHYSFHAARTRHYFNSKICIKLKHLKKSHKSFRILTF